VTTRLAVTLAVMVLAGCAGTPTVWQVETPTPSVARASPTSAATPDAPTPTPQPTPKPTPPPEEALVAACDGEPVSWAAPYAGKVHPLVVVDPEGFSASYAINKKWRDEKWTSPIQLVVCVPDGTEDSVKVGSCGRWKRQSDGVWGELIKYRYKSTIRVVIAETGKTLQRKALYGSVPPCGNAPQDQYSIPDMNEKPPWHLYGVEVTPSQVQKYATEVSTQKVQ